MAIFRGVGGSGSSSDNSFLQEVTAQATTATNKANEASASATSAEASATSAANSLATIQNTEVTSASFNTGDGVLTLTKTGGATVTADLDGRFLTSYTETNNLSTAVTWANVPDANITESSVTQYLTAANVTSPLTGGTGISIASNGTITNDSPDQTVALTGTGATTITGTYPNFTINSTDTTYTVGDGGLTTNDFTDADHSKLNGIEANATADQTGAEIKSAYEAVADTNAFTDAEKTKLSGIEASADVTDTANVTAAGALMDSEVTNLAQVKAFDSSDYLTSHQDISGKANLSGATFTGDVNIGTPPSGTQSLTVAGTTNLYGGVTGGLDVTGDITVTGTVDGVDIATRDAVLTSTTTTANSAMQDLVDDTTPQLGGDLNLNSKVINGTGSLYINQASTSTPAVHLISGDTSDAASPTIRLERFSTTTADDDSIGKIEFYGYKESLPPIFPTVEYANITGVIEDATNTTVDGQIDFNVAKDDTLTTVMSVKSTEIELPNGTDLDVDGNITVGGTLTASSLKGSTTTGGATTPVIDLEKNVTGMNGSGRFIEFNTKHHSTSSIVTRGHLGINQSSANGTANPYFSHNDGNCGFAIQYSGSSSYNAIVPASTLGSTTSSNINLGHQYARWNGVYLKISPNVSSDREYKRDIEELSEAEKRVAVACKGLIRKYRMRDAYEEKGENARLHIGIVAQDLQDAFTAESLDAHRYGMFCSDTWHQATVTTEDEDGNVTTSVEDFELVEHAPEGATNITEITRLSVRYEELLAFIISTT